MCQPIDENAAGGDRAHSHHGSALAIESGVAGVTFA